MNHRLSMCLFLIFTFVMGTGTYAQCLQRSELWDKVEQSRTSALPESEQIKLLSRWQKNSMACNATDDSAYSNLLGRLGALHYRSQNYLKAIVYLQESVRVGSMKNGKTNPRYLSRVYFNLGMSYKLSRRFNESTASFDSCIFYSGRHPDNLKLAVMAYRNLSNLYTWKGDYQQSVLYADKGLVLARTMNNAFDEAGCLSEKAQALMNMKNFGEASKAIRSSIDKYIHEFAKNNYEKAAWEDLATSYTNYAKILEEEHNPHGCIRYHKKAFSIYQKINSSYGCFGSLNNIGYTYTMSIKDYGKAKEYYNRAIQYGANAYDTVIYYLNISWLHLQKKDHGNALQSIQAGFHALPVNFKDQGVTSNPPLAALVQSSGKVDVLNLIVSKADLWLDFYRSTNNRNHLQHALTTYYLADKLVDQMRFEQEANESKLFWREKTHRLYENAIETCYLLDKPADGFYFFEKSKSALLTDQLNEQEWLVKNDRNILYRQNQLKKDLLKWKRKLEQLPENDPQHDELVNLVFQSQHELDKTFRYIKSHNPFYFNNVLDSANIPTLRNIRQNLLHEHKAFIELFAGDSAVYSMIITANETYFKKMDKAGFDSTSRSFISYISDVAASNSDHKGFAGTAYRLYRLIFGNSTVPPGRIIVSPDGRYFPFEALVTSPGIELTYFVEDHAVSYTYSARYLINQLNQADESTDSRPFLGVAPVHYPKNMQLSSLPESDHSLKRIRSYFNDAEILLSKKATKNNFLYDFSRYRIIQLYTHASDESAGGEPVIYFADSALYLSDLIPSGKPGTCLIVLSACETATGRLYQGEGVFSFNRGFAACGIPSSVSNLWAVDSKATYRINELFFKYLWQGLSVDVALQEAKKEFIKEAPGKQRLPYYWAATILAGKSYAFEFKKPFPWNIRIIFALLALLACWGIIKWTKKRTQVPSHS